MNPTQADIELSRSLIRTLINTEPFPSPEEGAILIATVIASTRQEQIEKDSEIATTKRETDKYKKCCMSAMRDNSISTSRAIRSQSKPEERGG